MKFSATTSSLSSLIAAIGASLSFGVMAAPPENVVAQEIAIASPYPTDALSAAARTSGTASLIMHAPSDAQVSAAGSSASPNGDGDQTNNAVAAAVADGVTTGMALSAGALELNPLIPTSPVGLIAVTGIKIGLVKFAETLPEEEKRTTLKASSAIWGGAAVNNLMVLMAAPPPLPAIAGLLMGFATWVHMANQYEEADRIAAAKREAELAAKEEGTVEPKPETLAMTTNGEQSAGE
jgi:hypothetical protein